MDRLQRKLVRARDVFHISVPMHFHFGTQSLVATNIAINRERLRLQCYTAIALGKLIYFFGSSWDIQWHVTVGRDSLFIPPHLFGGAGFLFCLGLALLLLACEQRMKPANGVQPLDISMGSIRASLPLWGILFGFANAVVAIILDEVWHRTFGLDARLWSPPHLYLMVSTAIVDASLLLGLTSAARQLHLAFTWRSTWCWAVVLAGAYLLDVVNFASSEALVVSYRAHGNGLLSLLYPILMAVILPLPLLYIYNSVGRFNVLIRIYAVVLVLQYLGTGVAQLGFTIMRPVSGLEVFLQENPQSTIGIGRILLEQNSFGLVGLQQASLLWISAIPVGLVALLDRWRISYRYPLMAAPVYSVSQLVVSILWFPHLLRIVPLAIPWHDLLLALASVLLGGLASGYLGECTKVLIAHEHIIADLTYTPNDAA